MSNKSHYRNKTPESISPADVPVESLPVIELSANQVQRVAQLAKQRSDSYRPIDGGVVFGDGHPLQNHLVGIVGELAVGKLYNTAIDTAIYAYGDDGVDLDLAGMDLDVKTTASNKIRIPELLVRADKPLRADLYIRAHILELNKDTGTRVRIIGCASSDRVAKMDPRPHPGQRLNHVVEPAEMSLPPLLGKQK